MRFVAAKPHSFLMYLACLLLLTACHPPGAVRPTVKLGLVAPFEGRYRYIGYDVIYAVKLALREANAGEGVEGYSVELVAYDDGADPTMAGKQARKLSVDPALVGAVGHFCPETTAAAASNYIEADISLVAPTAFTPQIAPEEANDFRIVRVGPAASALGDALLHYLRESGSGRAALVTEGGVLGTALRQAARQVGPVVSPERPEWIEEVKASGVRSVICDADPVTAGEVVAALDDAGWMGDFLGGPALTTADFAAVAGQSAEGAICVTPWPLPADISSISFAADYRAVSNGVAPGPLALPAYEATWILLEALERDIAMYGAPTRRGVAKALAETERDGLLGEIVFGPDGNWNTAPLYWYRVGEEGLFRF